MTRNGVKDASADPDVIRNWMSSHPHANFALACGSQSGVFVVDIDPRKNGFTSMDEFEQLRRDGALPPTLRAVSGGGGRHLYFQMPPGRTVGNRNNWLPGVDIKSDGGYVIIPPSTHISGGEYKWVNWGDAVAEPPRDLVDSVTTGGGGGSTSKDLPSLSDFLLGVPEGERDDTIFRKACQMRRQMGDSDETRAFILAVCLEAARKSGFPEADAAKKVDQAFKQDHSDPDFPSWNPLGDDGDPLEHLTDIGNKNRLLNRYGEDLLYVPQWGWLHWTSVGWQRTGVGHVMQLCERIPDVIVEERDKISDANMRNKWNRWALTTESAAAQANIERLARTDARVLRDVDDFDRETHLIACRNGILDLRTGAMHDFSRDDLVTKNTNIVYDPNAKLPEWEQFLLESTQGDMEMIEYLQMAAGYTLTGSNSQECFFIISGPPASGKSTFVDALMTALGTYAATAQSDTFMYRRGKETPKDEIARLAGMRMTAVSEIREGDGFNEALVKQITGGDKVTARFLYRDAFEFTPQFKLWIATNHDPASNDEAMLRRLKKIEFTHRVPAEKRDPLLKQKLKDPDDGGRAVLAWAVEGAKKFYARGNLIEPRSVSAAVRSYHELHDSFSRFINEHYIDGGDPTVGITVRQAFSDYVVWCPINQERAVPLSRFIPRLRDRGITIAKGLDGDNVMVGIVPRPAYYAPKVSV